MASHDSNSVSASASRSSIRAGVNVRLLDKANRLFTGTLAGRIIEVLQNARRAGAKNVVITNRIAPRVDGHDGLDGVVTVRDDGSGVADFQKLLDLGGSGWEQGPVSTLEAGEDPAGVGLFCLAPRKLVLRSRGRKVTVEGDGWTGADVGVSDDPHPLPALASVTVGIPAGLHASIPVGAGTELAFPDEPWTPAVVKPLAAFTGMAVSVDGEPCPRERFIVGPSSHHKELGCRIQVVGEDQITHWHRAAAPHREYGADVLVNFHGQVLCFVERPVGDSALHYLVDFTGEPTGIRLMLPARTCLVENRAFADLKAALELEAFKHLQRRGRHRLPYRQYLRAKELEIELPESEPVFRVGLLCSDSPEPVEVQLPKEHPLSRCYRVGEIDEGDVDDGDEANIHLLAALGRFPEPFVPVETRPEFDGYSWSDLPTIGRVEVSAGKVLQESFIGAGTLICVDSLTITAHCSDGKVFRSDVCMAVKPWDGKAERHWHAETEVYVTPAARERLRSSQIWHHFGGFSDEGDTYDTQEHEFRQEVSAFWMRLAGPHEPLRHKLMECLAELGKGWRSATVERTGRVVILNDDGSRTTLMPPARSASEAPLATPPKPESAGPPRRTSGKPSPSSRREKPKRP